MKSTIASVRTWSESPELGAPTYGYDIRAALCALLANAAIDGVETVRLLASERRYQHAHDKVYFVLKTHDLARDEKIVRLMTQFERVDYDLVPVASVGMIPSGAVPVI